MLLVAPHSQVGGGLVHSSRHANSIDLAYRVVHALAANVHFSIVKNLWRQSRLNRLHNQGSEPTAMSRLLTLTRNLQTLQFAAWCNHYHGLVLLKGRYETTQVPLLLLINIL